MQTLLVESTIECPNCGRVLSKGDIMYDDEYRDLEDYKDLIHQEEHYGM